jgi:DNA-binding NarL/FixJ family response regulator
VTGSWARIRARERIADLAAAGLTDRDLRRKVLEVLREVVGFSAYVWLLTDPVSTVGVAPLADVPCVTELPALIKAKYGTPVNRWTTLRQHPSGTRLLTEAVDGDLARSRVWREVMSHYGIADVASTVMTDHYGCWGFLDLWRDETLGAFSPADAELIASLAALLASALRGCQARTFVEPATSHRRHAAPIVLTLDDDLRITSRTAASQAWLNALLPPARDERAIPASVYNVAAQLLASEEGVDQHPAFARTHLADGFWLTLRAARLSPDDDPGTPSAGGAALVVTIEEASAAERVDLFCRAFAFTARETEVLGLIATGSDTRAIARKLSLSEHTVQDYLKTIFAKTGARDRVTVLSRALGTRREERGAATAG